MTLHSYFGFHVSRRSQLLSVRACASAKPTIFDAENIWLLLCSKFRRGDLGEQHQAVFVSFAKALDGPQKAR